MRYIAFVFVFTALLSAPLITRADVVSDLRAQINNLLIQIGVLQQQVRQLGGDPQATVPGGSTTAVLAPAVASTPAVACPAIHRTLSRGSKGSDVAALQEFLMREGVYTYPEITGYYGSVTEQAVQEWQRRNYVVQGGSPVINGFGIVGEKTRAAIRKKCASTPPPPLVTPVDPNTPPVQCKVWYDGCNTCTRSAPGGVLSCTKRACVRADIPRCEAYFSSASEATPLTIHSFSGPTLLEVNEVGTWKIQASDPANGTLSYQIDWGERAQLGVLGAITPLLQEPFVQTTTFTHAYTIPGTYVVTITVRNNATGVEARTTTTVQVVAKKPSKNIISATPLTGAAPLTTTFYANVGGYSPYRYELDFGDGSARAEMSCYAPSDYCQAPASVTHVYTRNGSYTARLYQKHVAMSEETLLDSIVIVVGESAGVGQCRSNGVVHAIGTTRQCITEDTLGQQCLSNGYYVCRPEGWVVEGQTPTFCTLEYAPVCGQLNGKRQTYGNACQLKAAGAVKVSDGECAISSTPTLKVTVPAAGAYTRTGSIPISWAASAQSATDNIGMYVALEDVIDGSIVKSAKVDPTAGFTLMHLGDFCNAFFSDALDAQCSSFQQKVLSGHTQYRVRAALFTPSNACFGFCAPGSAKPTVLKDDFSAVFTIR